MKKLQEKEFFSSSRNHCFLSHGYSYFQSTHVESIDQHKHAAVLVNESITFRIYGYHKWLP